MARSTVLKNLRAVGSKVQKRQQNERMNTNVGKKGSTKSLGTKPSFPRAELLVRRGKTRREMMDDALANKVTGKGEGPEKKKAIKERQRIEKSKKKLNALRSERDKLIKLGAKRTAAQDRRLKALRKQIDAIEEARVVSTRAKQSGKKTVSLPTMGGGKTKVNVGSLKNKASTKKDPMAFRKGGTAMKGKK